MHETDIYHGFTEGHLIGICVIGDGDRATQRTTVFSGSEDRDTIYNADLVITSRENGESCDHAVAR